MEVSVTMIFLRRPISRNLLLKSETSLVCKLKKSLYELKQF